MAEKVFYRERETFTRMGSY